MKRFYNFLLLVFISISAFSIKVSAQQDTIQIKLIETSDVHGALFPMDFYSGHKAPASLANVLTLVNNERKNLNQQVVLLDNGDILQGEPVVYYYNTDKANEEHICARVMNYMKYDAGTVGNHDIEAGHAVYDKLAKEFKFPWMAANAINTSTGKPYFTPYTIINKNGIKIAVLGLITPYIPHWLPEVMWKGIKFEDMILSAKKWVPYILEREKPDLMVGLFHSGVEYTYNNQSENDLCNENASELVAEKVPGFDIVFVGHDHTGWNKSVTNTDGKEVVILGTTSDARNIAVATVKLVKQNGGSSYNKTITGNLVESRKFAKDTAYENVFSPVIKEVAAYVSERVADFTDSISTRQSLFGNSAFVDLVHTIQFEYSKADISFSAPLSFDATIHKGPVKISDMFNFYRYENFLYTMKLTGQEIKDYLEYSFAQWFNTMKNEDDHLLLFKTDKDGNPIKTSARRAFQLKGQYYNYCSAAGIIYTVDVSKPAGSRVVISSMQDGKPFELTKTYLVALNSYRGNGGGGHLTEGAKIPLGELSKRLVNSTQRDLRFYMIDWMRKKKTVSPTKFNNWKIIPEKWAEKGKEKDNKILFDK